MSHIFQNQAGPSTNILSCHENDTKDDRTIALILSEEYANIDNEIARRLSNLSSVPHVPRVNTFFPSFSDASLDHQRLLHRLNTYGLYEVRVSGDGNCQVSSWYIFKVNTYDLGRLNEPTDILYILKFRALSDQLYWSSEYHKHVRKEIVKQLKEFPLYYEGYVPMKYKRYYKKMAKSGEWGDHVTLQAAADKFQAKICLLTSFRDTCFVEIVPQNQAPQRELWLSFWSEVHYNSIYQLRDLPVQSRPKKKHWLF
ncbi:OVARIAN TUMOR DOMAIN-containing deubiquitinating enzyme 12-like isoform X1 [Curcuma longa]|uniref:OVARIAN TUMOR DOMAIN-containing deubiquitinating enzyme 12-like isoform X1 n=1 Tax=Curcuma longa TaxID=136217 RepID=UPI003D9F5724